MVGAIPLLCSLAQTLRETAALLRYPFRRSCSWRGAEMIEPEDEITGGGGHRRLIASQADREQVLDALKTAFVHGRLTKDEFDHRVGQALATYAELDALTADIPARWIETQPPKPARESHNRKVIQRGTAAGAGASMVFTAALGVVGGSPVVGLVAASLVGSFVAVLLAGLLTLLSWVLEKGSSRQPSPGAPLGPARKASKRPASADPGGQLPPTDHGHQHSAEAVPGRLPRPRWPSPRRWRPRGLLAEGRTIYVQLAQVSSGQSRTLAVTRVAWLAASTAAICPIPKLIVCGFREQPPRARRRRRRRWR